MERGDKVTVGDNIRKFRKQKKMTQKELGNKLGISQSAINQFENNKTAPKLTTIIKVADALDVLPRDLIGNNFNEFTEIKGEKLRIRTNSIDYIKKCLDSESALNTAELTELFHENKDTLEIFWLLLHDFNLLNDEIQQLNISNKRICIVTESNVGPLYANEVKDIFMSNSKEVIIFEFTAGEAHKNLDTISELYTVLIENKFDRNDMLVALGGGVVGDMTGYAAATYLRGIDFIQIPTSLLAQVDSSIGGKTGVDYKAYKNMIGAFYQPKLVYMNLSTLNSLPDREYYSGMGEIVKHGLIKDSDYFYWLKENYQKILDRDYDTLFTMIYNSCNVKRKVVEEDPKEKGDRALLNFGHTIGHAVEKLKNFTLLHGECVSIGIVSAAYISLVKNYINNTEFNDICDTLKLFKLPVTTSDINANDVVEATLNDKKMDSGVIKFIVLKEIGNASIDRTIDHDLLIYSCEKIIEK